MTVPIAGRRLKKVLEGKARMAAQPKASSHLLPFRYPFLETERIQRALKAPHREDHYSPMENSLGSAWDFAPVMLWGSGTNCLRSNFNWAWAEFMGRSSRIQSNEDWIEAIHPEDRSRCLNLCTGAHEKHIPHT